MYNLDYERCIKALEKRFSEGHAVSFIVASGRRLASRSLFDVSSFSPYFNKRRFFFKGGAFFSLRRRR
jgi:hypothetical protein